jgi:hypothetical protein
MPTAPEPSQVMAYERCLDEVAAQAGKFMQRVVRRAAHDMPTQGAAASEESQRLAMRQAAAALIRAQDRLCTLYQRAMARTLGSREPGHAPACAAGELGLLDDDAIRLRLELGRLVDAAQSRSRAELAQLEALLCRAQGLHLVLPGHNPLRPEVHARCLHGALADCGAPAALRALWFAHLGDALGKELAQLYAALARQLRSRGVREADFIPAAAAARALGSWARAPM